MTGVHSGSVVAVTAHARDVAAADREAFATRLAAARPAGSVLVTTCHRIEAYAVASEPEIDALRAELPVGARVLVDEAAVRHLVSVAVGRDSAVLGEDEILHQLRQALDAAHASAPVDPVVHRWFAAALRAGRRARSWQPGRRRSLGDAAVDAITARIGDVRDRSIVIVGAGAIGAVAARAARHAAAAVTIANRSAVRARIVADAVGGRALPLDPGADVVRSAAGIVVALGAPWTVTDATAAALERGAAVVVDLSYPPAVPASLAARLGNRLVTADQLARTRLDEDDAGRDLAARLDAVVEESAAAFLQWLAGGDARAAADALVRRADREREAELDALWRRVPGLGPDERTAIEDMTRHLAARLLQEPLERLGRDRDGREGAVIRDVFAL